MIVTRFLSFVGKAQSIHDKETVTKVVIAFQEDFNDGSFNNADACCDYIEIRGSESGDLYALHETL